MLTVQKFGGSSLDGIDRIRSSAGIAAQALRSGSQVLAVVSASGSTTDEMLKKAFEAGNSSSSREKDALLACGEQQSAALMALVLQSMGIKARSFTGWQAGIFTQGSHGSGRICLILPGRIKKALNDGCIPVVAGFQGLSFEGDISTLGRGGSDTSAAALACALEADCCEIYTDVDGIYTADPRLVYRAVRLDKMDYRDMLALSLAGSQVLHPEAVRLGMEKGLRMKLLSSFSAGEGSELCFLSEESRPDFAGVTRDKEKSLVTAVGKAADARCLAGLFRLLGENGIPALEASLSSGRVSLKVAPEQLDSALRLVHSELIK